MQSASSSPAVLGALGFGDQGREEGILFRKKLLGWGCARQRSVLRSLSTQGWRRGELVFSLSLP